MPVMDKQSTGSTAITLLRPIRLFSGVFRERPIRLLRKQVAAENGRVNVGGKDRATASGHGVEVMVKRPVDGTESVRDVVRIND